MTKTVLILAKLLAIMVLLFVCSIVTGLVRLFVIPPSSPEGRTVLVVAVVLLFICLSRTIWSCGKKKA